MVHYGVTHSDPPTAGLLRAARAELVRGDGSTPNRFLVALHERRTREVFDAAAALLPSADAVDRELGVLILRELRTGQPAPLLVERLHHENDAWVLGWVISALGYHGAREALGEVLRFVGHEDSRVRFFVASALPGLVDPERVDPRAVAALNVLCRDADADVRYYALYALVEELKVGGTFTDLLGDEDEQVRELAGQNENLS